MRPATAASRRMISRLARTLRPPVMLGHARQHEGRAGRAVDAGLEGLGLGLLHGRRYLLGGQAISSGQGTG